MKIFLFAVFLIISQSGYAIAASTDMEIVERNIGKLLLSHDEKFSYQNNLNPFGSAIMLDELVSIYNGDIRVLNKDARIKFFWSAMWHLDFDGHSMLQFQKLILKDCGDEFINRLEKYVNTEAELKRNKTKLYLSKKVLVDLLNLKSQIRVKNVR